ncbi:hypothetical protein JQ615_11485 [Bradyrhizobium jicamae]|uniref:Uncharacterized protein n=1 Tax=Bradyrhizobium jicamae TaxID=280332 RepID=A0ABS5FGV2_9BRAD|nr:hypothetical protein [Bradyrhizobium jicamae]MBR0796011.1 hypothetical protein [Bradyrhizobium jicamae]MBR0938543.1 hypothetical protein [Bradyrhizobium jicamae]
MAKQFPFISLSACIATFFFIGTPIAQAKQQCRAAASTNPREHWSWRLIDGRKCWYEGKPMLSKSLLEWPARVSTQARPAEELASALVQKPSDPIGSEATPTSPNTFDALWRTRVEQR